jgi:hypothetical protein
VLNHGKYRDRDRIERRREYQAELMRERRSKDAGQVLTGANIVLTGANKVLTGANPSVSVSSYASDNLKKVPPRVFVPPTADEVSKYAADIGYPLDGQAWCDSYAQKGWGVGRAKMKDWRAAVRNWKANGWKTGQPVTSTTAQPARPPVLTAEQRRAMIAERGG